MNYNKKTVLDVDVSGKTVLLELAVIKLHSDWL